VQEPSVAKTEADSRPFLWISINSDRHSRTELTELADRYGKRLLQTLPGVANIIIGGERRYAMRIWLNPRLLAAHQLTAADVEAALREQNVEIPGGRIESQTREFTVRVQGDLATEAEFENLILAASEGRQVRLADVGRAELGSEDYRTLTFFNGRPTVGLGVVRQSQSNLLDVAERVKERIPEILSQLPQGIEVNVAYDASLFVQRSINEVILTIFFAFTLVILVVFLFLRNLRATFIPLLAVPVSLIGSFAIMQALGFSLNILTLLALVLAVGLVIDDAIVMLENIYRRLEEGEELIAAAFAGSRQVAFAIIATTLSLIAVFLPVAFQRGATGRLFYEFGITLAIAVAVSSFVALTLTPMLCSRFLRGPQQRAKPPSRVYRWIEDALTWLNRRYGAGLTFVLAHRPATIVFALLFSVAGLALYPFLQRELVPEEDRGIFLSLFKGPLGSTPQYTRSYVEEMERIVLAIPEVSRNFSITAVGFGTPGVGNEGLMFTGLVPWEERERKTQQIIGQLFGAYGAQITGGLAFPLPVRPLGRGLGGSIEFVVRGPDFPILQQSANQIVEAMRDSGMFNQPRVEPAPNKPQLEVTIDRARAADLQVPVLAVATSLETLFGGREVTQFRRGNDQYEVIVQVEDAERVTPADLGRIYVRSGPGELVPLSSLVQLEETVIPENYPHFDRFRSVTVTSQMGGGYTLGDGVDFLERSAPPLLPPGLSYQWDGEARDYLEGVGATFFLFLLALLFTFLVLSAQFESFLHPVTIFSGVGMAISAGLMVLFTSRFWGMPVTDNLFSRFGLIMLIGLIAKNGILIVEFANQLQVQGKNALDAAFEAAILRFRPILMTAISTVFGVMPLALAIGAGAETRNALGIVVVGGLSIATFFSLFVIPAVYVSLDALVVRRTGHSSAYGLIRAGQIRQQMAAKFEQKPRRDDD
ncbi:MAG: efflux RND transporter permease subunit, partial [Desulfuromonadales bacterium]|nr:efflux RND transporter permease subunit [Desulfuromonadales bacterium]